MATTVAIGRAFELHSLKFLNNHLNMALRRVGGPGDEGIDLRGWWYLPSGATRIEQLSPSFNPYEKIRTVSKGAFAPLAGWGKQKDVYDKEEGGYLDKARDRRMQWAQDADEGQDDFFGDTIPAGPSELRRLRVFTQCKATSTPVSGRNIRELEGIMSHFHGRIVQRGPHQYDIKGKPIDRIPPPTIAVLVSQSGFSDRAMITAWRSPSPILLVHLPGGRVGEHLGGAAGQYERPYRIKGKDRTLGVMSPLTDLASTVVNPRSSFDTRSQPRGKSLSSVEEALALQTEADDEYTQVKGLWTNPAMTSNRGLLGGTIELRREILAENKDTGVAAQKIRDRWRVWYKGKKIDRVGPSLEEALVGTAPPVVTAPDIQA